MESSTEFEGRSVEEALERAGAALGVKPSDVRYEIIEDGRRGFLGIGTRPVKIRVMSKEETPGLTDPTASSASAFASGRAVTPKQGDSRRGGERGGGERWGNDRAGGGGGGGRGRGAGPKGAGAGKPGAGAGAGRGPRGGRPNDRSRQPHTGVHPSGTRPRSPDEGLPIGIGIPEGAPYSNEEAVRLVAGRILREMGLELRARLRDRDGAIILELGGADGALLVENDGEVIESLQHVLNKILARDERFDARVVVDCDGFRSRHDEATVERAMQAAEESLRTGKPVHLEGLNPYERRLAHIALAENKAVRTYSTGEGAERTLTVEPAGADADDGA